MSKDNEAAHTKRGRQFWIEQLQAFERSGAGQSLRAYAQSQGLNEHTAYGWRKRLRGEAECDAGAGTQRWTRVPIEPQKRSSAHYRVELPNGIAVEVGGAIDEDELGRVLRVVSGR